LAEDPLCFGLCKGDESILSTLSRTLLDTWEVGVGTSKSSSLSELSNIFAFTVSSNSSKESEDSDSNLRILIGEAGGVDRSGRVGCDLVGELESELFWVKVSFDFSPRVLFASFVSFGLLGVELDPDAGNLSLTFFLN
jgi:hypothetical protein